MGLVIRQRLALFKGLKLVKDKDPSNLIVKADFAVVPFWVKKKGTHGN